jgi:hypothetical protein
LIDPTEFEITQTGSLVLSTQPIQEKKNVDLPGDIALRDRDDHSLDGGAVVDHGSERVFLEVPHAVETDRGWLDLNTLSQASRPRRR